MVKFSFVIPVYNSERTIREVVERLNRTVASLADPGEHEIILVNDGSKDHALAVCQDIGKHDNRVTVINLSRNFGQANAIMAGLNYTCGEYVICLDDDLQTLPEEFPKLFDKLLMDSRDLVYAIYLSKKHGFLRNIGSAINAEMSSRLINKPRNIKTSSFFIARRFIIDEVIK